jgi:alpha-N-arabinofuranosidase
MEMLDLCYDNIDYVSLHRYYQNPIHDTANFLAKSMDMDSFIKTVVSICDAVGGKRHSKKKLNLSFDEWNVWYHSLDQDKAELNKNRWGSSLHLLEDIYNFEDALLVGGMLITLLNNSDRVKIACLAQLVNVIAPIMTSENGCWAQTTYWPFLHVSRYGLGKVMLPGIKCEKYSSIEYDDVPMIDSAAVLGEDGSLNIFLLNRVNQQIELNLDLRGMSLLTLSTHIVMIHNNVNAVNTEAEPRTVTPNEIHVLEKSGSNFQLRIPPLSWNVIRFSPTGK